MKNLRSHFVFSKSQRNGIFLLVLIIGVLQLLYFFSDRLFYTDSQKIEDPELVIFQKKIDSIKQATADVDTLKIFPFNPNFLTDYRGYTLGMTVEEIDQLLEYRKGNKWVNSAQEFQVVTGVSDSLLNQISPYFKFPEWVTSSGSTLRKTTNATSATPASLNKQDLNSASLEDLIAVKGIGETLAGRIINYRNKIGGFVNDLQLKDIYGLNYDTREELLKNFTVKNVPVLNILNINTASVLELSEIPYFNYELAREIVNYRSLNERINSFEELAKIKDFPSEKIDRIALYLAIE